MKLTAIRPEYTDRIPKTLDDGVLYISEKFSTAAHSCCCGCGVKIVTPLKPGRWSIRYENGLVTLDPSVGNWSSFCQSHYVIEKSRVLWVRGYSEAEIRANRAHDQQASERAHAQRRLREQGFWGRLWSRIKVWLGI